jgi:hypothetical protein
VENNQLNSDQIALATTLQSLEEQLLDPTTRRQPAALESLLAADFTEFGSSGRIFDRATIIAELQQESYRRPELLDFAATLLAPTVALVTYRTMHPDPTGQPALSVLRSSLWIYRQGRWQVRFHQGTRVSEASST